MILFPLGQPIFANLGADGISMFYLSCIVSQLVYSLGGSVFKGGIGSEMVRIFFEFSIHGSCLPLQDRSCPFLPQDGFYHHSSGW